MARIFYPSSEKLRFLLDSIHNREIALPDFQRDFVWDPGATDELIESICQNFPAGSLLRIKNSNGFYFAPRAFEGAPELNKHAPSHLILDGQQRLTSLYQAFYGAGEHRYYISFQRLKDGMDLEDAVFYLRRGVGEKHYGEIEQQAAALVFPLKCLFGEGGGFEEWLDAILDLRVEQGEDKAGLKKAVREFRKRWILNIEEYEFPMVTLEEDTGAAAVCTIFETLNRTGVKLLVFDLLAARFWHKDVRLRDLWEKAKADFPILAEFGIDPYYILQGISIYAAKRAPSCKRGDVLQMTVEQIQEGWKPVVCGLAKMLDILRDDCGVIVPKWLPYATMLVTGAATLAATTDAKGPESAAIRNKFKRWFWCAVFAQAYDTAPNSQAVKDAVELKIWFAGGEPPELVRDFKFSPESLREVTPRQRAIYRGCIALILRNGTLDFHKGTRVTAQAIQEEQIEDHHIFPQDYLNRQKPPVSATLRDCVLNRTLIDKDTNIRISNRPPSDYLTEVEACLAASDMTSVLASHLLGTSLDSALRGNDFECFLQERQDLLALHIRRVTE